MIEKLVTIHNDDRLLRRVWYPDPSYVRDDMTVTSLAFKLRKSKGETGLSVDIERLTTHKISISDPGKFRLFAIKTGDVRSIGLDCIHKPEPNNHAHAEIVGIITNRVSGKLAKHAIYVKFP